MRIFFLLIIIIFAGVPAYSQPPTIGSATSFIRAYDNSANGSANSVQQTSDGGYIMAGFSYGYLSGWSSIYLIKTNVNGDTLWTRAIGSLTNSYENFAECVKQTSDGGYIVAGYSMAYSAGVLVDSGSVVLLKTDSLGNVSWLKKYGGTGNDRAQSVALTSDGGYIVTGYTSSYGVGAENIYLLKTDSLGSILWTKCYSYLSKNFGNCVLQTGDGGYIITGHGESYYSSAFLIKTDSLGTISWAKSYETNPTVYTRGKTVFLPAEGGFLMVGTTNNYLAGAFNAYVIKTDTLGNQLWARQYGGSNFYTGYGITQVSSGAFFISGSKNNSGWHYPYIMKLNDTGTVLSEKGFGNGALSTSGGYDYFRSVLPTSDGGLIGAGSVGIGGGQFALIKTDSMGNTECFNVPYFNTNTAVTSIISVISPTITSGGTEANQPYDIAYGANLTIACLGAATVWPGDTDHNSIADNDDLLQIGLYHDTIGLVRTLQGNLWQDYPSANWGEMQANNHDIKHIDCNGDGIIDDNDTLAIHMNFNSTHAFKPQNTEQKISDSPIYFSFPNGIYSPGDWIDADIVIGTSSIPVSNLYGISFDITYDASLVQPGTETLTFPSSWFASPGINSINITKINAMSSLACGAETRKDHLNSDGYGMIAKFKFQLKTSIPSSSVLHLFFSHTIANDSVGTPITFAPINDSVIINVSGAGIEEKENASFFSIAPNPFSSYTSITFNRDQKNSTIKILNSIGEEITVFSFTGKTLTIEKENFKNGMYFIEVIDSYKNRLIKKLIIQ